MMDFSSLVLIVFVLVGISAICTGVIDKIMFHYDSSVFTRLNKLYWNPSSSWINKWDQKSIMYGQNQNYSHWYYLGIYKTTYKEKFIFSSTILVFLTDGFHTFRFIGNTANQLIFTICLYNCGAEFIYHSGIGIFLLIFCIIKTLYSIIFSIMFDYILKKKEL